VIGDRRRVTAAEIERRFPCAEVTAPYSYDCVGNLGRRSPQQLRALPDPVVGDRFTTVFGGRPAGRILMTGTEEHLTAQIMGTVMSYVLVPEGARTRLLLKPVARERHPLAPLLAIGDLIMARRQLRNLARLAERHART
jgi:hypothetical protein